MDGLVWQYRFVYMASSLQLETMRIGNLQEELRSMFVRKLWNEGYIAVTPVNIVERPLDWDVTFELTAGVVKPAYPERYPFYERQRLQSI